MPYSSGVPATTKRSSVSRDWSFRGRDSDLDWALHSPDSKVYRQRRSSTWKCGNSKNVRHVISQFSNHSSMHGVHYICTSNHRESHLTKIIYRLIFGLCIFLMTASVIALCQESFSTESVYISSTIKEIDSGPNEDHFFPQFPRITICRTPGYTIDFNSSKQDVKEYAFLALGYPFTPLVPEERALMVETAFARNLGKELSPKMQEFAERLRRLKTTYDDLKASVPDFNLTQYIVDNSIKCEDMFLHCIAYIIEIPCCHIFRPALTSHGNCYTLDPEDELMKLHSQAKDIDFSFMFDMKSVPDTEKSVGEGYVMHLGDPRDKDVTLHTSHEYSMINGFMTTVKTRLIKTSRLALFTPWHGLWTVCPTIPPYLDTWNNGDRYFKLACEKRYMEQKVRKACGCRYVNDQSNASMKECDPDDVYGCFLDAAAKDNLTGMMHICRNPCLEYHYDSEVNFLKIGGDNRSRLLFVYDGYQYNLREYRTTTVSSFLSQIGGILGLYVGASIITAVELIFFIANWLWYRFMPSKRVTTSEMSPVQHRKKTRDKNLYFY